LFRGARYSMIRRELLVVIAACVFVSTHLIAAEATTQPDATITVHVDRPGIAVSPTLYGVFFEEINRAGEGGLYGELVANRSFEDSPTEPAGWSLIKSGDGDGAISVDSSKPLNENNTHALRIE